MIVCNGNLALQDCTHSGEGTQCDDTAAFDDIPVAGVTRILPLCDTARFNGESSGLLLFDPFRSFSDSTTASKEDESTVTGTPGWADSRSVIIPRSGVSKSVAFNVPGSAGSAGLDPSIESSISHRDSLFASPSESSSGILDTATFASLDGTEVGD